MAKYGVSVFNFRRDLRLQDNIGLINALSESKRVLPIFIFTPEQLVDNRYKSDNCVQFMIESLIELDKELKKKGSKLFFFYGKPEEVLNRILKNEKIEAVYLNVDYTPYSCRRDKKIQRICKKQGVDLNLYEDILLNPVGSIKTGSDTIYTKFTPYFNKAKKVKIDKPKNNARSNYVSKNHRIIGEFKGDPHKFYSYNENLLRIGGRSEGLKILKKIKKFDKYNKERNCLTVDTTQLSAYNKFGCVSIREVYWAFRDKLGMRNDLIKQLYWRDFYYNITWAFPEKFGNSLKEKYDRVEWLGKTAHLNRWKEGRTGFPIVDACMTEMNVTGFMHNRGRLIVSSFLIKTLLIDWRKGEQYFAQTLIDYDVAVNQGNWLWSSGGGADSQPFFRIFNPWSQSEKFDPDGEYIKRWLPELKDVDPKHLHQWDEHHGEYDTDYPKPVVDYKKMREKALAMYKRALY